MLIVMSVPKYLKDLTRGMSGKRLPPALGGLCAAGLATARLDFVGFIVEPSTSQTPRVF